MVKKTDNKRIAKNTLMLYIRMLFVMAVTIYTSRIILEKLGVTDFGIYNSVAAVVAMLGFLNNTLSVGTSRFLTFELGKNNTEKLKATFSTTFYTHLILALIVSLILIIGGPFFIEHKLIIPKESVTPAIWVFFLSVFTTFINITQVPYTSVIIAHENMNIYAYIGVIEAILKLGIAFAISLSPINKLVFYAILVAGVQFLIAMLYRLYCIRSYKESKIEKTFDRSIFKGMMTFNSWNLIANVTEILTHQGLIVLINMFFVPAIAAAQAIGAQVSSAMMQFINNFRTAVNPQIIKHYASDNFEESQKLTLQSTVYIFDLVLLLGLPLIVVMDPILHIWLVDVPPYAVVFTQFIVARCILGVFSGNWYTPMVASGKLKYNSIASVFIGIGEFVLLYLLLKIGFGVMWVQYLAVIQTLLYSFYVKPYVLCKQIGYSFKDICKCVLKCVQVSIIPLVISYLLSGYITIDASTSFGMTCLIILIVGTSVIASSIVFMDRNTRSKLYLYIKAKL